MRVSRNLLVAVVLLSGIALGLWASGAQVFANDKENEAPVFVLNLTSGKDDLHAAWMGLQLAEHALNDGRKVILFLNVRAPELATTKVAPTLAFQGKPPIQTLLRGLTARGAKLLVCPTCLDALGIDAGALIEGAELATREALFGPLGPNTVVFSY